MSLSSTTISNGIIKAREYADRRRAGAHDEFDSSPTAPGRIIELLRTRSMTARRPSNWTLRAECTASHASVDCSTSTGAQRDQSLIASDERWDKTGVNRATSGPRVVLT
jgi:hypothetical protein